MQNSSLLVLFSLVMVAYLVQPQQAKSDEPSYACAIVANFGVEGACAAVKAGAKAPIHPVTVIILQGVDYYACNPASKGVIKYYTYQKCKIAVKYLKKSKKVEVTVTSTDGSDSPQLALVYANLDSIKGVDWKKIELLDVSPIPKSD